MAVRTIPISEVRQKLKDILATLEKKGEPYVITQHSRPKAVLVRYYDHQPEIDRLIEENTPERVIAAQGLQIKKVANSVAVGEPVCL